MRKVSQRMVQRGGGRRQDNADGTVTKDRTSQPAQLGHQMANNKGFQFYANHLIQRLVSPFIPKKAKDEPSVS